MKENKNKTQTFMTVYTVESFTKKRKKGQRITFDKVALPSEEVTMDSKVYNMLMEEDLDLSVAKKNFNPLNFSYKKDSENFKFESTYAFLRFSEFVTNTCLILNRRLTPGFAKNGRVRLVGVDWRILDNFLCQFESCNKTSKRFHPVVDRKKVEVVYYYYEFSKLPDLGVKDWWIKKHYPNEDFGNYSESFYTKLKFGACSVTNRMWVDYWQLTSTEEGFMTA